MASVSTPRWLASTLFAAALGVAALLPATARADDDELVRVIVDVADVVFRGGHPYYRHGGYDDRLVVVHDRYGRPHFYRDLPRHYRAGPPHGNAHGYWKKHHRTDRRVRCDRYGRCVSRYYDPRYDRRYDDRYYSYDPYRRYDRHDRYDRRGRYWDGYRWRYHRD